MAEQEAENATTKRQRISFFDNDKVVWKKVLQRVISAYIDRETKPQPNLHADFSNTSQTYDIYDAFSMTDSYWIMDVQDDRFDETFNRGILYRPDIVNEILELIDRCWKLKKKKGVMIKGPHGVGKSHSIINLVRKLLYDSNGKYLITFIPDCEEWSNIKYLYKVVCNSFGCTMESLGLQLVGTSLDEYNLDDFIAVIDSILAEYGMRWIFVFDQINSLFARHADAKDLAVLPFPYRAVKDVLKVDRIISIISASANNNSSYRESHSGFMEYNHPCSMSRDEINTVFQELTNLPEEERNEIYEVTGCIPLQVAELISLDFSVEMYQVKVVKLIRSSLVAVQRENASTPTVFQGITESALACLLFSGEAPVDYDRKYSIQSIHGGMAYYHPLFPMVLVAYRLFFWDSLLSSLNDKEDHMLTVCKDEKVTQDVCGQLFELIVINRCIVNASIRVQSPAIARGFPQLKNSIFAGTFHSQNLPKPKSMKKNGIYVPKNPNFPAIDMIWKHNRQVCGVQIHTAIHNNTEQRFENLCTTAGWFDAFTHVHMLYLSPTSNIALEMQMQVHQLERVHVAAVSIHNVSCLANLPW